jgi:8-oxo-dGTP pyrophosphatase MutT (NUDIX family)
MAHIHDKIDFVANAYIVNDDAVLLRIHDKHHIWLSPGGHVELDEDPAEAAIRECLEEVGLQIELIGTTQTFTDNTTDIVPPHFINRHRINDSHEHIEFVYIARSNTRSVVEGETEKSSDIRWFTREELDDPSYGIPDSVRYYAHQALTACGIK